TTAGSNNAGNGNPNVPNNGSSAGGSSKSNEAENESNGSSGGGVGVTNEGSLNCTGCGVTCSEVHASSQGKLCGSCYHHWRRTGVLRPTTGPSFMNKRTRGSNILGKSGDSHKRRPPKGMYINHDDIVKLASTAQNGGDGAGAGAGGGGGAIVVGNDDGSGGYKKGIQSNDLLASMDREIVSLLTQIQNNKQKASGFKRKIDDVLELLKPPEVSSVRLNSRWNNEELMLAVQGVRMYGRDFQAIADTLGTKTETQVRTFFMNYRRRFNLDAVLKEFEATNAATVGIAKEVPLDQTKASAEMTETTGTGGGTAAITSTAGGDNEGIDAHKSERSIEKEKQDHSVSAAAVDVEIMEVK
uniref:SANT domain-containing protein n=1 Tax=Anopheles maculatus TaxID=74869 RepID=A0A182T690_9DIPT